MKMKTKEIFNLISAAHHEVNVAKDLGLRGRSINLMMGAVDLAYFPQGEIYAGYLQTEEEYVKEILLQAAMFEERVASVIQFYKDSTAFDLLESLPVLEDMSTWEFSKSGMEQMARSKWKEGQHDRDRALAESMLEL